MPCGTFTPNGWAGNDFTESGHPNRFCSGRMLPGLITNVGLIPGQTRRRRFHRRIDGRQGGQRPDRPPHRRRNTLELAHLGDTLRSRCGTGRLRQRSTPGTTTATASTDYTFMDRNLGADDRQGAHREYCRPTRWPPADCCTNGDARIPSPATAYSAERIRPTTTVSIANPSTTLQERC